MADEDFPTLCDALAMPTELRVTGKHRAKTVLAASKLAFVAAVLCVGLVSACSSNRAKGPQAVASHLDAMRGAVTKNVVDTERRAALLQSIDGLQADLETLRRVDFDTMTQIRALNTRPDVPRTEMEAALDSFDQQRRDARGRVVQRHFELTGQATATEWKELAGLERKALLAAVQ